MKLTGGQIVCESLIREGVDTIFGLPGGAILPLYQTLSHFPQLKHILVRHEQGAAHAADGYARVTGKPGVAWGHVWARSYKFNHRNDVRIYGFNTNGFNYRASW